MAMNRVQFQPGLSMPEFLQRYATEEQCATALQAARWPNGFTCPVCGGCASSSFSRGGSRYWQCQACRHQCSLRSGTMFAASKLPLTRWFLALQLLTQAKNNVSALELKRHLGVCYRTAWLLKHKIMEAMHVQEQHRELDGRVELDDAYLGGERFGGKVGRGSENKIPIVAAVQTTADGQPILACLRQQRHSSEEVAIFAAQHIATTATIVTDGLQCFRATQIIGAEHQRVITGSGKAAARAPQFRAVNTLLGNLKTAIGGTYHAFAFVKYSHRYLAEFQYRFNRRFNMRTMLAKLLIALAVTPPRTEQGLRAAEVYR
jgi:hypothetical protein